MTILKQNDQVVGMYLPFSFDLHLNYTLCENKFILFSFDL